MPIGTPFHDRALAACESLKWKDWAGYYAVCSYLPQHDREYFAFRHACGMIDVTPLFKYEVKGPDAARLLSRVTVKDIRKLKPNQVTYLCWCDDDGKVVDDGTVTRIDENHYRLTAAEPSYAWFSRYTRGMNVEIEDSSETIGVLSVQGPTSRALIQSLTDANVNDLRFFRHTSGKFEPGFTADITRTGYTGDLGYEIWVQRDDAPTLWDCLMERGKAYGLMPCGLDAMDVTRVEAGFVMNGVDYFSAHHCMIDSRKSSPYELNLGWTVQLDREPFMGRQALQKEKENGSAWGMVGVELNWTEYESLFDEHGLPPEVCTHAWRTPVPIYDLTFKQVGYATSGAWSPILKKNLALATLKAPYCELGTQLRMEVTVEFVRKSVTATVVKMPFYDPPQKRAKYGQA